MELAAFGPGYFQEAKTFLITLQSLSCMVKFYFTLYNVYKVGMTVLFSQNKGKIDSESS